MLSGPGKNALGTELMKRFRADLYAAGGAPVLVRGEGDAFSAGLDLLEVASLDAGGMTAFLLELEGLLRDVWTYPGPTAAAVNGHAIAGGCLVAMACDLRVATDNPKARIGLNEVALGLRFPPAILRMIRARLPASSLEEVLLGAALYGPADALRLGLVDAVAADAVAAARERLSVRAAYPADGYATAKRDLRGGVLDIGDAERATFAAEVVPVWTSDALKARIRGFLRK